MCVHRKVGVMMTWVESKSQRGCREMLLEWGMVGMFRQDRVAFRPQFINCTRLCQILVSQVLRVLHQLFLHQCFWEEETKFKITVRKRSLICRICLALC